MIRLAKPSDAAGILAIYAPYVKNSSITFETEVPGTDEFEKGSTGTWKTGPGWWMKPMVRLPATHTLPGTGNEQPINGVLNALCMFMTTIFVPELPGNYIQLFLPSSKNRALRQFMQ